MRYAYCFAALAATAIGLPAPTVSLAGELFTIELEGGERRQITEAEKFVLKAVRRLLFCLWIWIDAQENERNTYQS